MVDTDWTNTSLSRHPTLGRRPPPRQTPLPEHLVMIFEVSLKLFCRIYFALMLYNPGSAPRKIYLRENLINVTGHFNFV